MKQKTTISVEKEIVEAMKEKNMNISKFCEEQMREFLKLAEVNDLSSEIAMIEEQKRKLDEKLYKILNINILKHQIKEFDSKKYEGLWAEFIDDFENWYYGYSEIDIEKIIYISGLQVPQLKNIGLFINEYEDDDIDLVKNNIDYAIMRYNEVNIQPIARSGGMQWW